MQEENGNTTNGTLTGGLFNQNDIVYQPCLKVDVYIAGKHYQKLTIVCLAMIATKKSMIGKADGINKTVRSS